MRTTTLLVAAGLTTAVLAGLGWHASSLERRLAHTFRLADVMADYQRYADKLYFAGQAQNWELADWYLWKLTKASWVVADGDVVEYRSVKEYDVAELTKRMLKPAIQRVDTAIAGKDAQAFQSAYATLVSTCNACHHASEHGFVQIVQPDEPTHKNQKYAP
ncbi:hypothetical protein GCM10027514_28130 [Azotobacter armeniacus]